MGDKSNDIRTYGQQSSEHRPHHTRYYQDWRKYKGAVNHMWRFFCARKHAVMSELSVASASAWSACWRVYDRMSAEEQNMLDLFFTTRYDKRNWDPAEAIRRIARDVGRSEATVQTTLDRAAMMVAVERGLADAPTGICGNTVTDDKLTSYTNQNGDV